MSTPHTHHPDGFDGEIDRYLAGEMSAVERTQFEARCTGDPALSDLVRTHRAVGFALARLFVLPPLVAPPLEGPVSDGPAPVEPVGPAAQAGALASITSAGGLMMIGGGLLLVGVFVLAVRLLTGGAGAPLTPSDPVAMYLAVRDHTLAPDSDQTDPALLSVALSDNLGRRITITGASGVEYLGVRSMGGGSPVRIAVLARVDGQPALVVLDLAGSRAGGESVESLPPGVHRHSASIGALVATELSVRAQPAVLPHISADR